MGSSTGSSSSTTTAATAPGLARDAGCVVVHKRRGGYGEAINAARAQARGEFSRC